MIDTSPARGFGHQGIDIKRLETRFTPLLLLGIAILASWPLASALRFIGKLVGSSLFYNATPTDVTSFGLVVIAIAWSALNSNRDRFFWAASSLWTLLLLLILVHLLFGVQENASAWNSRTEEFARTLALMAASVLFFLIADENIDDRTQIFVLRVISASGIICGIFAILQSFDILPNFYFQWYGPRRIGRPAGGFTHPHFYAATCVLAACAVHILAQRRLIGRAVYFALVGFLGICVVVSTSRVGMIFTALVLAYALYNVAKSRPWYIISLLPFILIAGAFVYIISGSHGIPDFIRNPAEMFYAAFTRSDGDFLRGRGVRWQHEIALISDGFVTILFGYGHQPFVSHNLILRQLQATGLVGTVAYLTIVLMTFVKSLHIAGSIHGRTIIVAAWIPIFVGSMTLPILVSVPLNCALFALALCVRRTPSARSNAIPFR